ncbi:MAG: tetratricopeptide repeat protein [Bacteroidota bacterium]
MDNPRLQRLFDFLKKAPNDAFTLYSIAYEYQQMEDWAEAQKHFERLKSLHPDYIGLYYHLGAVLERQGQNEQAVDIYKAGIALAQQKRERHALSELQSALNTALGLDDEEDW